MVSYATGSSPSSIAAADFNGDNKTDLIVNNIHSNLINVFLSYENGSFASLTASFMMNLICSVRTVDFDHNNKTDFVATS
jgi:hypothetical protein